MQSPMVQFRDVTKVFPGGTRAVNGVSLDVPQGQFCVVLGHSGAGKSTLLRLVNGLVRSTEGEIEIDGIELSRATLRSIRSRVAMIHQQFHLVTRSSVYRNVISGRLNTTPTIRALFNLYPEDERVQVCKLLEEVGLDESHLYRRASMLSGGQQQRVAIARAFILEPAVVLADEPVASLDPAISINILSLLKQASRRHNTTVMCSLHQVEYAREFADRIVGMKDGRVVFDGPPEELDDSTLDHLYGSNVTNRIMKSAARASALQQVATTVGSVG